jgi:hypothetical protein
MGAPFRLLDAIWIAVFPTKNDWPTDNFISCGILPKVSIDLQFIGASFEELLMLRVPDTMDWHKKRPEITNKAEAI